VDTTDGPVEPVAVWHVTALRETAGSDVRIRYQVRATYDVSTGAAGATIAGDLPDPETVRVSLELWLERVASPHPP